MPEEPEESPGSRARRHFHWCLGAVMVPVLSLPLEWVVAYREHRSSERTPDQRRWSHWLLGLVAVDTVVAALVIALLASGVWGWRSLAQERNQPRPREAVRIGVTLTRNVETAGAQIGTVGTGSPAEHAGLRPGDVITALDGNPIHTGEDLSGLIKSSTPGVSRTLRVRRAGEEIEIVVTPELRPEVREPPRALLDVAPTPSCFVDSAIDARILLRWRGLWAGIIVILAFWLAWRRTQPHAPALWPWVVAALASMMVTGPLATLGVCLGAGGRTTAGPLVASLAQVTAALLVGLLAMRHMAGEGLLGARLEPVLGARRAILLGLFYLLAVSARLSIFASAVAAFGHIQWPAIDAELGMARGLGWPGLVLFALTIVVVGPLAEEVLFRGVILPRLTSWLGATWAIVVTSVIFAVLHEGFGGVPLGLRAAGVFVIALVLGWARLRTGGLAAPIAIHVATNALALLARP